MTLTTFFLFFRALNEMWKCQNLLRHQVKDLVDLIKQPKVSSIYLYPAVNMQFYLKEETIFNFICLTISSLFLMAENTVKLTDIPLDYTCSRRCVYILSVKVKR